jgi:hypothetical protein
VKENKRSSLIVSELSLKFFKMFSIFTNINKKAFINAIIATLVVIAATIIGSVNLQNFDALQYLFLRNHLYDFRSGISSFSLETASCNTKYWKRT